MELWGQHFDDTPQWDAIAAQLLAMIGYMIDDYLHTNKQEGHFADPNRWFFWLNNLPRQRAQQRITKGDSEEDLNLGRQAQLDLLGISDAGRQYSTGEC